MWPGMDCALSLCATRHNWDFVQSWPRVPVSHEHQKSLVRNTDSGLLPHPSPAPSRLITSGKKEMRTGLGAEVGQAGNSKQTHHGYRGQGHSGGKSPSRRNWGEQTACWVCGDPGWDSPQQCRERSALLCLGPPKPQMTKVQCSCPAPSSYPQGRCRVPPGAAESPGIASTRDSLDSQGLACLTDRPRR